MSNYPDGVLVTETPESITFFDSQYRSFQARRDNPKFSEVIAALEDGDIDAAKILLQPITVAAEVLESMNQSSNDQFRRKIGEVKFNGWELTIGGEPAHGYVVEQLLRFSRAGVDFKPLLNFITNLYQNPSRTAREELYVWLEKAGMPITPDGHFIAYKRIKGDYTDIHSGTFDNSVGKVIEMDRFEVDDNRNVTCSAGLHFCSRSYLPQFRSSDPTTDRVVLVKVNPADVVAIPADHNDAKGRTWRYEVVGETTLEDAGLKWEAPVYVASSGAAAYDSYVWGSDEDDEDGYDDSWDDDDEDDHAWDDDDSDEDEEDEEDVVSDEASLREKMINTFYSVYHHRMRDVVELIGNNVLENEGFDRTPMDDWDADQMSVLTAYWGTFK